jgi:hypothetical protein
MNPGLVVQHGPSTPPGLFGERAELARSNAFLLFDVFWERARRADRRDP